MGKQRETPLVRAWKTGCGSSGWRREVGGEGMEMLAEFIRGSRVRVLRYAEIPEFIPA